MSARAAAFNARATLFWKADRLYRVYLDAGILYFIRIGGQDLDWVMALSPALGPLGAVIGGRIEQRKSERLERVVAEFDRVPPQVRVLEHRHNLRIPGTEVTASTILPPDDSQYHGSHVGRWQFRRTDGAKWKLQFEDPVDLVIALKSLSSLLGNRLQVEAEWAAKIKEFEAVVRWLDPERLR